MPDQIITITIPSDKVATALEGFLALYPNVEKNADGTPKFTDKQWIKEKIRQLLIKDIRWGLQLKADQMVKVEEDNNMIQ